MVRWLQQRQSPAVKPQASSCQHIRGLSARLIFGGCASEATSFRRRHVDVKLLPQASRLVADVGFGRTPDSKGRHFSSRVEAMPSPCNGHC